jgi:endonuclease YncB( thermonuclease family)
MPVTVDFNWVPEWRKPAQRRLLRTSDGDTPYIEQPIRMVSCDTPEKEHYAGKPEKAQETLDKARQRLAGAYYAALPEKIRDYYLEKLSPTAAEAHITAGHAATKFLDEQLGVRLLKADGNRRALAIIPSGEIIDSYGRMLAYFTPWFAGTASDPLPPVTSVERRTFNLDMIESGWAAFFPVYPSLPKDFDFNLAIAAAEGAWSAKRGQWKGNGAKFLLAYEFRACVKLARAQSASAGISAAFERHCVDLRSRKLVGSFGYSAVPPPYRMWIWPQNVVEAKAKLGLVE